MNVNRVEILVSAVSPAQYPTDQKPEVAFVGRSNVGKSSLMNKLVNRKSMARVSSKPGKTATINFYNVEDKLYFVDLPGYGYAKVSKTEKEKWGQMIEVYLQHREPLKYIVLLVDSRHKPSEDDLIMLNWIRQTGYPAIVAATKYDKLSNKEKTENIEMIRSAMALGDNEPLIPFSSETGYGKEEIWAIIDEIV